MRPWSEGEREVARINAAKLGIAIRALSDISMRTQCSDQCAAAAKQAMREMGRCNMPRPGGGGDA